MRDEDDPASRVYPVNITILQGLHDALDTADANYGILNSHVIDLIIVGFYWLLRPAECVQSSEEARSQAFLYRDIHFTLDNKVIHAPAASLNDEKIRRLQQATLTFSDQKNAVRGEQIGHKANADPTYCPVKALGRIALRLQQAGAPPDTPIHMHYNTHQRRWHPVKSTYVTNALRHSATRLRHQTGIDPFLISARSLRPGGATALLCANIDANKIQLLGRWKSDAMFRYLRIQADPTNFAALMLQHGAFTFTPTAAPTAQPLPVEAPADIRLLLAREELHSP